MIGILVEGILTVKPELAYENNLTATNFLDLKLFQLMNRAIENNSSVLDILNLGGKTNGVCQLEFLLKIHLHQKYFNFFIIVECYETWKRHGFS